MSERVVIKRVAYCYNSALEDIGQPAYFLDCLVSEGGTTQVDRHESFQSRGEFMQAIEELVPLLDKKDQEFDPDKYLESL